MEVGELDYLMENVVEISVIISMVYGVRGCGNHGVKVSENGNPSGSTTN